MNKNTPSQIFADYERGKNYKSCLGKHGLYEQSKMNERFFVGDQWWNANCGSDRPLCRHNVIKRIGDYKISMIGSSPLTVNYSAEGVPNTVGLREQADADRAMIAEDAALMDSIYSSPTPGAEEINMMMSALSDYYKVTAERTKLESVKDQALRNSYISGTGVVYVYWDPTVKTGLYADETHTAPIMGDIRCEVLDIENVNFGDPGLDNVQDQPYILIAQRKSVEEVKREAKRNNRPKEVIDSIKSDMDYSYQAGERGELEPEGSCKTTVITKLWKEFDDAGSYTIKGIRVCSGVVIRKEWDLKIRMYPIAVFPWERRRNCIYGESEITYLIPNQIAINRMLTASVWAVMLMGMPIMAVNRNLIPDQVISNNPGQLLEFTGMSEEINSAIKYFAPPSFSPNFDNNIMSLISNTLTQSGANDAALGDIRPDNTSAIIAVREAATMPLQIFNNRYHQFCEDIARIFAEFWIMLYGKRSLKIEDTSGVWYMPFDGERYRDLILSVKVDVGASTLWSEAQSIQTLDNLFGNQVINTVQYLERLPKGIIPDIGGLIKEMKQADEASKAAAQQQMMQQPEASSTNGLPAQTQDVAGGLPDQSGEIPEGMVQELLSSLSEEERDIFLSLSPDEQLSMIEKAMGGAKQ